MYESIPKILSVAINPRTREMFKPGDMIYRGELLGYTGRTGNAYNVTNKHLHFVYMVKNSNGGYVYANPEEIINGSVDWKDGDPSTKKIIGGKIGPALSAYIDDTINL